jgi:predicted nucleic acid-binding protein
LPLTLYAAGSYRKFLAEAHARIGGRDPNDVDVLALTLSMGYPLWSNDRDFEGTGVQRYTTAQLLKVLFEQGNEA